MNIASRWHQKINNILLHGHPKNVVRGYCIAAAPDPAGITGMQCATAHAGVGLIPFTAVQVTFTSAIGWSSKGMGFESGT